MQSKTALLIGAVIVFLAANIMIVGYALRQSRSHGPEQVAHSKLAEAAPADEGAAPDPALFQAAMERGQQEYATCTACHGPDGKGMQVGPKKMAPSLVGSKIALGDPDRAALLVLKGVKKESDDYTGIMAPLPIDDEGLAGVLTYVRNSFGNKASMVTPAEAKAARARFANTPQLISRAEIDTLMASNPKVPVDLIAATPGPGVAAPGVAAPAAPIEPPPKEEPWEPIEGIVVVGGRVPNQRPERAPTLETVARDDQWYSQAIHGLTEPYPSSLRFLDDQGNWFTPFTHPGMTGPYDLRNWHHD
jgi:mono/diheme cytochrome c family protein